ncbi:MAG: sulfite exporter TauE/SafE family protein [Pseudomonadota bacterium]|nr:sulfite exporter TauE/SafE family protein [Pseudomonadota bacterium]
MTGGVGATLLNAESLLLLVAIAAAASFAKGVTTFGLNLIGVPAIATLFDVQTAVVVTLLPKFLSDIYMAWESRDGASREAIHGVAAFAISGSVAVACATFLLASLANRSLTLILGAFVLFFVLLQLSPRPPVIPARYRQAWGVGFGLLSGASQALTGVAGPTTSIYLYSLSLDTTAFVFVSSLIYLALDILQLSAFAWFGLYSFDRMLVSVTLVLPVMLGTWLGIKCRRRLSARRFRQALLGMLFLTAIALIIKGL